MSLLSRSPQTDRVVSVIEAPLAAMGYELVEVTLNTTPRRTLVISVERADRAGLTVGDCTALSHEVATLLDVADAMQGRYDLQVGSPGIDRPLTRAADFSRFAGHLARLVLSEPVAGRRRLTGTLAGYADGAVRLVVDGETVTVPPASIAKARLVMTDALLAAGKESGT